MCRIINKLTCTSPLTIEHYSTDGMMCEIFCRFTLEKGDNGIFDIVDNLSITDVPKNMNAEQCLFFRNSLRAEMVLNNIIDYIVNKHQNDFFNGGRLNVLTTRMLADRYSMHETTIRRQLNGVYLSTDRGPIEVLLLLDSGCKGIPKYEIKKEMISVGLEMNDRVLAEHISEKYGIKMSRRTINKYKNSLNGKNK